MHENFLELFKQPDNVFSLIVIILSIGLIVTTLEDLKSYSVYQDSGLLSWKISKHRSYFFTKGKFSKLLDFILKDSSFYKLLMIRLILLTVMLLTSFYKIFPSFLFVSIFLLMLLPTIRSPFGLDGAHQMNLIVLLGLSIATLAGVHSKIASVCLVFIAGELILSYFIAGITKIISPIWYKSYAIPAIFSTQIYGHEGIFKLVIKYKYLSAFLCWPMLAFELIFAISLFSKPICLVLCIFGFLFHFFNAVFMGLNTFLFSFLSTYPALLYCSYKINNTGNIFN